MAWSVKIKDRISGVWFFGHHLYDDWIFGQNMIDDRSYGSVSEMTERDIINETSFKENN
jgi:hypothetical protein